MNWLHGKPTTVKPFDSYFFCNASSVAYCGVLPHFDATLTSITALPLKAASVVGWPLSVLIGAVQIDAKLLSTVTGVGAVPAGGRFAGSLAAAMPVLASAGAAGAAGAGVGVAT